MTTPTTLEERLKGMIGMLGEHNTAYWITPEVSEKKLTVMELLEQEISFDRATRDREMKAIVEKVREVSKETHACRFHDGEQNCECYYSALDDVLALLKDSKET